MVDVIVTICVGVLIGVSGVIPWALSAVKKDDTKNKEEK